MSKSQAELLMKEGRAHVDVCRDFVGYEDGVPGDATCVRIELGSKKKFPDEVLELPSIERLRVRLVYPEHLEAIASISGITHLYIDELKSPDVKVLRGLERLRVLRVDGNSTLTTLNGFTAFKQLDVLFLENFRKVSQLNPLSKMQNLKALGIDGSMWTAWKFDSLKPIGSLKNLVALSLSNTRSVDESLRPLRRLKSLRLLDCADHYSEEEWDALSQALPDCHCDWFWHDRGGKSPYDALAERWVEIVEEADRD